MLFLLAWRNLWRNRTRSLVTIASVLFAVLLATLMNALQIGSYDRMTANLAGQYTGFVQIHKAGYWDDKTLENAFPLDDSVARIAKGVPGVRGLVPRLESFALASNGSATAGCQVAGVDPTGEDRLTALGAKVRAGRYLRPGDDGALVAEGLARNLALGVGDTMVLLGQGWHGATAAGKFPVRGIAHFGSPELDDHLVYLPLAAAQRLYAADGLATAWVVEAEPCADFAALATRISRGLGPRYEAMDWARMLPDLRQAIAADRAGGLVMIGVLYLVLAFGIFGTLLMMVHERRRELGVLVSVGMRRTRIAALLLLESALLSGIGVAGGMLASLPLVWWLSVHPMRFTGEAAKAYVRLGVEPVFPTTTRPEVLLQQGALVWAMALAIALVPVVRTLRLDPLEATRR
jgi:ABC-type lipoprotein release transport system permease subunit